MVNLFSVFFLMITIVSSIVTLCSLPQQFRVSTHNKRFLFFYLLTIVATVEFFLSGTNLMKQFCFFEIMTLASFAYVPNDESGYAKKASFSYLAYGLAGGLVMLYGLMLLYYTFSSWDLTSIRMAHFPLCNRYDAVCLTSRIPSDSDFTLSKISRYCLCETAMSKFLVSCCQYVYL